MKTMMIAGLALALANGAVMAQTSREPGATPLRAPTPAAPNSGTNNSGTGNSGNMAPGNMAPGANTGSPGANTTTGSTNPAVNPGGNAPSGVNASGQATIVSLTQLENGSNSFTEGQARTRLEGAGLSNVTGLQKDDQGIWRGRAMRNGQQVTVGFDYKGNIGVQ